MPRKICAVCGCDEIAVDGEARCEEHLADQREVRNAKRAAAQQTEHAAAARRLYSNPKWVKASRRWLQLNPLCVDCGELGVVEVATDVDHIVPHKGDLGRFWDRKNWQSLCHRCHSRKTAREVWHSPKGGVS